MSDQVKCEDFSLILFHSLYYRIGVILMAFITFLVIDNITFYEVHTQFVAVFKFVHVTLVMHKIIEITIG